MRRAKDLGEGLGDRQGRMSRQAVSRRFARPRLGVAALIAGAMLMTASASTAEAPAPASPAAPPGIVTRDEAIRRTRAAIELELKEHGGSWEKWAERLKPYREDIREYVSGGGKYKWPWPAKNNYVFQGAAVQLHLMDTFEDLPEGERPLESIVHFHRQLKSLGVDLIVALIPSKLSIHPDYLQAAVEGEARPARAPEDRQVSVAVKRLMLRLLEEDVEVVDLHKAFAEFRRQHGDDVPLYYVRDGHFINRGARLAAQQIAERLKRYDFVQAALPNNPYIGEKGSRNDGVKADKDLLLIKDKRTGGFYADSNDSPVVVIGDSHMLYNDGKAHVSAQVAHLIGMPVAKMGREGTSREIPVQIAQDRSLKNRRVIVTLYSERMIAPKAGVSKWPLVNLPGARAAAPEPPPARVQAVPAAGTAPAPAPPPAASEPAPALVRNVPATGIVTETAPQPSTKADYPHYLMHFYLTKMTDAAGKPIGTGDGIVSVLAMHNRKVLPIAGVTKGQSISLRLTDMSLMKKYEKLQTGLVEVNLEILKTHYWGEVEGQPKITDAELARAGEDDGMAAAVKPDAPPANPPAPGAPDPENADWTLVIEKAVDGKPIHVALARRAGAWAAAFGTTPAYNRGLHVVDASALKLAQGEIQGALAVTVNPDDWFPKDKKPVPCVLTVKAAEKNGAIQGTFTGKSGPQEVSGAVSGRLSAPRGAPPSARVAFRMERALTGGEPHVCAAKVGFTLQGGKAGNITIGWPPDGNPFFWSGKVTACDLKLAPGILAGEMKVTITSERGSVKTGEYRFVLDGKVIGSTLAGTFQAQLAGADLPGGTFIGTVEAKP